MKRRVARYLLILGASYVVSAALLLGDDAAIEPLGGALIGFGGVLLGFLIPLSSASLWVTTGLLVLALRLAHRDARSA